ncbi:MAG: YfiR family protein [bacterium]
MTKFIFHLTIVMLLLPFKLQAQMGFTIYPSEYQVKAKYLYNFTRFVDWPDQTFSHPDSPFIIGILGEDPFGIDLDKTVEGKKIKNRNFIIKRFKKFNDLKYCHILYIGIDDHGKRKKIIKKLSDRNILTVSDKKNFAQNGGIINFIIKDKKIRFQINFQAAQESNIQISSKILRQADIINN